MFAFGRDPLAGHIPFLIVARNTSGVEKVAGLRCNRRNPYCQPYRRKCSTLSSDRWKRLARAPIGPLGSSRSRYLRDLANCGTLIGLTREQTYAYLGDPESDGKSWASWDVGYDFLDEMNTMEIEFRMGRTVRVRSPL